MSEDGTYRCAATSSRRGCRVPKQLIIDSGVADNVMPNEVFENEILQEKTKGVKLLNVSGVEMRNFDGDVSSLSWFSIGRHNPEPERHLLFGKSLKAK